MQCREESDIRIPGPVCRESTPHNSPLPRNFPHNRSQAQQIPDSVKANVRFLTSLPFLFFLLELFLLEAGSLGAQPATLQGEVRDAESGEGLPGAVVRLFRTDREAEPTGGVAGVDGSYRIGGIPSGSYRIVASSLGYDDSEGILLLLEPGAIMKLNVSLNEATSPEGTTVVVTASKRSEKATEAPASTTVISAQEVEEENAVTPADYVRGVKGLDIVQGGLAQNTIVARGFNNAFSGNLTTITDNRFANLPSLRYNAYYFIPLVTEDIEQIEIVRGPGSALYGPNATNGVLHIITRSPFSSAGTWASVAVGERDLLQGMVRHAGLFSDRIGYKISAQYMQGTDWGYEDPAEAAARRSFLDENGIDSTNVPDTVLVGRRDSAMKRLGGEARIDWLVSDEAKLTLSTGMTLAINNTDATGIGAAQAQDWSYWYHQARFRWKDLFAQVFLNRSDAGRSYALRTGLPVVDRSTVLVGQVQHQSRIGEREKLTYGIDAILTNPVTDSTVTGRNEEDDRIEEYGVYAQSATTIIADRLDLIAALRLDYHSRLDDLILSPRAAVVWTPERLGAFRLTYNRAYSAPTTNDLFLDIVAERTEVFDIRAAGVPGSGYTFRRGDDGEALIRSHFSPDPAQYYARAEAHLFWEGLKAAAAESDAVPEAFRPILLGLPAPPPGRVGTELRVLDHNSRAFEEYDGDVADREQVQPTINSTIEFGWQGTILDRVALSVDLYRSDYTDFVGPLETITPSVFYEPSSLRSYLTEVLVDGGGDTALAAALAVLIVNELSGEVGNPDRLGVPIAAVTPEQAGDPTAVMLTFRNYGDITLYGADVGLEIGILPGLGIGGNFSYVDRNFFENLDGIADLSLNAPKFKANGGVRWHDGSLGANASLLLRHVDGFEVRSGVYSGTVPTYTTLSLETGYRLPWIEGAALRLTIQNLMTWVEGAETSPFETRHREFVGTPPIGRLAILRLSYQF